MNYNWNWRVFFEPTITGDGLYIHWMLSGLGWTLGLSLSAWLIALAIGSVFGVIRTIKGHPALRFAVTAYVELFRNVPLLVQLFIWYYVVPQLLPVELQERVNAMNPTTTQFIAAVLCLGLFTSVRVCEQIRSGIQSQPPGQFNAALALGLTPAQAFRFVLVPRAFRVVIPPLTSEFLNVFKNSAVALTIGLLELTQQSRQIAEFTAQGFESFIVATAIYVSITGLTIAFMHSLENRLAVPGFSTEKS